MKLSNLSPQGTSLVKYDPMNEVLFGQWNETKLYHSFPPLAYQNQLQFNDIWEKTQWN